MVSIRANPLDLIFSRVSLEGEYAPTRYLSVEIDPTYVFGVPGTKSSGFTAAGYTIGGRLGVWFQGHALRGWFLKGVAEYDHYQMKSSFDSTQYGEGVVGAMLGSQTVFGRDGGFTLSGGIGIGYVVNQTDHGVLTGPESTAARALNQPIGQCGGTAFYGSFACATESSIRILGQFALGYTF